MIITVEDARAYDKLSSADKDELSAQIVAIEQLIRTYTNNNFQNRNMRICAVSQDGSIIGSSPYFKVDDTLQISDSKVNDGLYTISTIEDGVIGVNEDLYDASFNLVTKIVYPADVKKGVIDMLIWEQDMRSKVGIKSETLSRHSVTYYDQDSSNQVMGYPVSILGFLKPYMRARF